MSCREKYSARDEIRTENAAIAMGMKSVNHVPLNAVNKARARIISDLFMMVSPV